MSNRILSPDEFAKELAYLEAEYDMGWLKSHEAGLRYKVDALTAECLEADAKLKIAEARVKVLEARADAALRILEGR